MITAIFGRLSKISRARKIELFNELAKPTKDSRVLDVGAQTNPNGDCTLQFIDLYDYKSNVSAINLSDEHVALIRQCYPEVDARIGDACALPWPDKSFDIVYCNAVIEHVGGFERQKKLASEIMRVGKRWFVTTPNRWYPFEFHTRLPFVTWLPRCSCSKLAELLSYNHVQRKYVAGIKRDELRIMTARELQQCFPTSRIIKQRVTFMAETLIAFGTDSQHERTET